MANIVNFTDKQFENRLNDNLEELVQGKKAVESPTAFLLGGQPGSGKTSLRSAILEETQGNVIVIDNDTFKQQHPNFDELVKLYEKDVVKHVTPYSNRMTEAIISRLSDQGYNLVIEGTGRTTDVPIQTATMLQAKGYETKMYVMAVPKINSYLGTIERYETMYADEPMTARATPKQAHDIVVKNLPNNLELLKKTGLFSDIRLYNREGVKLYSSLETPSISPKETLEKELNRKVSSKEIQPTLERIEQKMVLNKHQEAPEFKAIQQKLESLQPPTPPIPKTPKLPGI
ncbi:zeta toxin family protein [Carnobacterium maltaromaticum]|uniref:zeta toxin family protein n=1 Tax=Carnobacterium maltaromaticum TaxID=2751 RepID=UPI0039AEB15E